MQLITAAVASLLALHVSAAPRASPSTRVPDKCGPTTQGPSDPPDTCFAKPLTVDEPAAFGILGSPANNGPRGHTYDWSSCNPTVEKICTTMIASNTTTDRWYFETGPTDFPKRGNRACQMAFWLPGGTTASAPKTRTMEETLTQCENIFNTTVSAAAAHNPQWVGASINLKTNPAGQPGQYELPGGSGTGMSTFHRSVVCYINGRRRWYSNAILGVAVNALYPSYIVVSGVGQPFPTCHNVRGRVCECSDNGVDCARVPFGFGQ